MLWSHALTVIALEIPVHNASLPSIVIRALSGVVVDQEVKVGDGSDRNARLGILDRGLCRRYFGEGAVRGAVSGRVVPGRSYAPNLARVEGLCGPKSFESDFGGFQAMQVGKHSDNG